MKSVRSDLEAFRKKREALVPKERTVPATEPAELQESDNGDVSSALLHQPPSRRLETYPVWVQRTVLWFVDHDRVLSGLVLSFKFTIWAILLVIFIKLQFAAVFLILSAFYVIFTNLRSGVTRKENELSAYSVFNPNCERLPGTLTAEQFEQELRHGAGSVR